MKNKEKDRVVALRNLMAKLKDKEISRGSDLSEKESLSVLKTLVKQRKESFSMYEAAGRKELAQKEKDEILIIKEFMPEQLSTEEVIKLVNKVISETNAQSMKDMGTVMGKLKELTSGKADSGFCKL